MKSFRNSGVPNSSIISTEICEIPVLAIGSIETSYLPCNDFTCLSDGGRDAHMSLIKDLGSYS